LLETHQQCFFSFSTTRCGQQTGSQQQLEERHRWQTTGVTWSFAFVDSAELVLTETANNPAGS
jgi:hypothetical protein